MSLTAERNVTEGGSPVQDYPAPAGAPRRFGWPVVVAFVLVVIVASAAWIRLRGLDEARLSLSIDEARLVLVAQGLQDHHWPVLPSGKVYTRGLPNVLAMWPSLAVLGASDFAARLPSVIFGVLLVPILFLHGLRVGGLAGGLTVAALAAWYPPFVFWSRQAWFFSLFVLLWSLALLGLDLALTSRRQSALLLAAGSAAVGLLTHELFVLLLPAVALTLFWLHRDSAKGAGWRMLIPALGVMAAGLVALAAFTLTHRADTLVGRYGEINEYLTLSSDLAGFRFYGRLLVDRHWTLLIAALIGLVLRGRTRRRLWLLGAAIVPLFIVNAFVLPDRPQERYGLALIPPLFVLAAAGLGRLRRWIQARLIGPPGVALAVALYTGVLALHVDLASVLRRTEVERVNSTWLGDLHMLGYRAGDLILTDMPTVVYAYLGRTDYWLVSRQYEKYAYAPDGLLRDIHTGGRVVRGPEDLNHLVRAAHPGQTAWVLGSDRSFQWYELVDGDLRRAINEQADVRYQSRDSTRIFRLQL